MPKIMCIGDLHFGERGDSEKFNNQILEFIQWSIDKAKENGCTHVIQLGDWFHHRNKVQVQTLNYGIKGAKMLGDAFGRDNVFVLSGNHDLFYLDRLDVSSIASIAPYVTVVDTPMTPIAGCLLTPWIATQELWEHVVEAGQWNKYLFAHLELNGFMVNEKYEMEHGYSHRELKDYDVVITGHYHSLQTKDNILYTGTPYPITMNECNEDHGVVFLDTEEDTLSFVKYEGIRVVSISFEDIETLGDYDPANTTVRIEFPDSLEDENIIEETKELLKEFNFHDVKIKYRGEKAKKLLEAEVDDIEYVENIDAAVKTFIETSSEVGGIDKMLLSSLYSEAMQMQAT